MISFLRTAPTRRLALSLALCGVATLPGTGIAQEGVLAAGRAPLPLDDVRMFTEALDRIRSSYVEPIDDRTLLEYAIRGMLAGLDPHSSYLVASDYEDLQETTTGEFGGLGIEVGQENGYIRVIAPIDETPAQRAGIQAGDLIIRIDGKPLQEMLPDEAAQLMRGAPGTDVTITIVRESEPAPFDLTITREIITAASVRQRTLEPGYGYIRISQFRVNTGEEVVRGLKRLQDENPDLKGLIIDLRNNPGGVLQAAVATVDAFVTDGMIVYTKGRLEDADLEFHATQDNPSGDVPVVVLINEGSASASEIVAGALQDLGRAVIMGRRSFGKGSVQTVLPLGESNAIKLTTSLYFTPSGRSIQAQGIEPDIAVEDALVTRLDRGPVIYSEADLQGHLENATTTDDEAPADEATPATPPTLDPEQIIVSDYPLNEALNLLKGVNRFKPLRQAAL